jgi:hypothetical protein
MLGEDVVGSEATKISGVDDSLDVMMNGDVLPGRYRLLGTPQAVELSLRKQTLGHSKFAFYSDFWKISRPPLSHTIFSEKKFKTKRGCSLSLASQPSCWFFPSHFFKLCRD